MQSLSEIFDRPSLLKENGVISRQQIAPSEYDLLNSTLLSFASQSTRIEYDPEFFLVDVTSETFRSELLIGICLVADQRTGNNGF